MYFLYFFISIYRVKWGIKNNKYNLKGKNRYLEGFLGRNRGVLVLFRAQIGPFWDPYRGSGGAAARLYSSSSFFLSLSSFSASSTGSWRKSRKSSSLGGAA